MHDNQVRGVCSCDLRGVCLLWLWLMWLLSCDFEVFLSFCHFCTCDFCHVTLRYFCYFVTFAHVTFDWDFEGFSMWLLHVTLGEKTRKVTSKSDIPQVTKIANFVGFRVRRFLKAAVQCVFNVLDNDEKKKRRTLNPSELVILWLLEKVKKCK